MDLAEKLHVDRRSCAVTMHLALEVIQADGTGSAALQVPAVWAAVVNALWERG
jgi:hypothetical protein